MALSKHQKKSVKDYPELQDEEPVLTFHGPRMRKGQGISMVFEDMQMKYLVRYQSGTGVCPGVVTCLPYAQPPQAALSHARAHEPETVSSGSKAKASTSRAVPSTSRPSSSRAGPSTSKGSPSTGKAGPSAGKGGPSTSKAGPSASKGGPSTSKAGPSTSKAGPSASKGGPSTSKGGPSTSKGGPSTSKAGPSASKGGPSTSKAGPSASKASPSAGKAVPSFGKAVPSASKASPSSSKASPSAGKAVPSFGKAVPSFGKEGPGAGKEGPGAGQEGPSAGKAVPSAGKEGPGAGKEGPGAGKAGPDAGKADPGTCKVDPNTGKVGPSPGRVGPRTCRFSTRKPVARSSSPSANIGGQSTSGTTSSGLGGAIAQGASGSSGAVSQGAGGASASGPQSSASKVAAEELLCPVVSGWEYEWLPESRVLRYSTAQLKHDSDTAIQMATRKEQNRGSRFYFGGSRSLIHAGGPLMHGSSRSFTCGGSCSLVFGDMGGLGDPGEGSSSAMAQPPAKRSREKLRVQGRGPGGSRGDAGDPKKDSSEKSEVQVNLPKSLSALLVQDWELLTLEKKLCNLPAKISVEAILSEYVTFPLNCRTRDKRYAVSGLVAVIKEYFNVLLSTQLLYDFERPQYAELVVSYPSSQMCQLYGGAHLLRLFQQLGPMLTCTPLDASSLSVLMSHLQDLLDYLANDPSLLFIEASDYVLASEEYLKVAE